jgi:single-strand DNA-binding protein
MLNKIEIIGRVGQPVETKVFDGGSQVSFFNVATSETYKDKAGNKVQETEWFRVVVWNKLSEICSKYVTKGMLVRIEGKMKTREYDPIGDGSKAKITELIGKELLMLSSGDKPSLEDMKKPKPKSTAIPEQDIKFNQPFADESSDDLPF